MGSSTTGQGQIGQGGRNARPAQTPRDRAQRPASSGSSPRRARGPLEGRWMFCRSAQLPEASPEQKRDRLRPRRAIGRPGRSPCPAPSRFHPTRQVEICSDRACSRVEAEPERRPAPSYWGATGRETGPGSRHAVWPGRRSAAAHSSRGCSLLSGSSPQSSSCRAVLMTMY